MTVFWRRESNLAFFPARLRRRGSLNSLRVVYAGDAVRIGLSLRTSGVVDY